MFFFGTNLFYFTFIVWLIVVDFCCTCLCIFVPISMTTYHFLSLLLKSISLIRSIREVVSLAKNQSHGSASSTSDGTSTGKNISKISSSYLWYVYVSIIKMSNTILCSTFFRHIYTNHKYMADVATYFV
jgi:hypothetical protein